MTLQKVCNEPDNPDIACKLSDMKRGGGKFTPNQNWFFEGTCYPRSINNEVEFEGIARVFQ